MFASDGSSAARASKRDAQILFYVVANGMISVPSFVRRQLARAARMVRASGVVAPTLALRCS